MFINYLFRLQPPNYYLLVSQQQKQEACTGYIASQQRGLIIAGSLFCLILGGFYWHNIRSGTYKGQVDGRRWWEWEGGNRASVRKKTPRGTSSSNKPPHQSQTTTEGKANMQKTIWVPAILLKPPRGLSPSASAFQCFAWPRKSCVEKQTWPPLVILLLCLIVYEYIYNMEQQKCISFVVAHLSVIKLSFGCFL